MSKEKKTIEEGVENWGNHRKNSQGVQKGVEKGIKKTGGIIEKDVKSEAKKLRR
jgi:hypothetical protein